MTSKFSKLAAIAVRCAWRAALFCAGFVAICALLSRVLPARGDIPVISAKLAWLDKHGSDYDTLFIGTSRIFHQVLPPAFDARMRELGIPSRSYNLAADGMYFPENLHVIELALPKVPRLRNVIIETGAIQRIAFDESDRAEFWHSAQHTWTVVNSILQMPKPPPFGERARLLSSHAWLFFKKFSSHGRARDFLKLGLPVKPRTQEDLGDEGAVVIHRTMTSADALEFARLISEDAPGLLKPALDDKVLEDTLLRFVARMKAKGIAVAFVNMPTFRKHRPPTGGAPEIDLGVPSEFPELWKPENRYDPHHLNAKIIPTVSRILAERSARLR